MERHILCFRWISAGLSLIRYTGLKHLRDAHEISLSEYRNFMRNTGINSDQTLRKNIPYYSKLDLLRNEIRRISVQNGVPHFSYIDKLTPEAFDPEVSDSVNKVPGQT